MESRRARKLLAASVAGILAAAGSVWMGQNAQALEEGQALCYGINKCKGTGSCGGKGHSCAGENSCKGQGYLDIDKDTCLKIEGGRLTPSKK